MSRIASIFNIRESEAYCQHMLSGMGFLSSAHVVHDFENQHALGSIGRFSRSIRYSNNSMLCYDGLFFELLDSQYEESFEDWFYQSFYSDGFHETLLKINGDFSLVFYEATSKIVYAARDRVGIRPLYYAVHNSTFLCSSRLQSILASNLISKRYNRSYVARYAGCHYRYIDNQPEESPYNDIMQLPASYYLTFDTASQKLSTHRYWSIEIKDYGNLPESELSEEYKSLILSAVKRRISKVKNPIFSLSGGMDSSTVLASAVYITGQKQHAVSTVYEDKTYDESEDIATILDDCVETWERVRVENIFDLFDVIKEMIAVNDEPLATATWLSHYLLTKELSSKGVTALFGGLGGDELNAGEYEYFFYYFADLYSQKKFTQLDEEILHWQKNHDHPVFKKNKKVAYDFLNTYILGRPIGECVPDERRLHKYFFAINEDFYQINKFQPNVVNPFDSFLKNRTYQDIFYETSPCCLRAEDRHCTSFGIRNIVPFFDFNLINFMFSMSGNMKIRRGVTKYLLREATRGILPESTRTRVKKTGWNAPAHVWFLAKGLDDLKDLVRSQRFKERGIFKQAAVELIIKEHEDIVVNNRQQESHMMFLWQLSNLELWLDSL